MTPLLALFDLDGTLFLTHDPLSGEALRQTLEDCFDATVDPSAPANVVHRGLSAKRIARNVLRAAGVDDDQIDRGLDAWCGSYARRYLELLANADTSDWLARPGAAAALVRLRDAGVVLALVTGNPEPIARARLVRLDLADFFPTGTGAYGCEAEDRASLLALARARAGDSPTAATAEIGDTREDVATAKAAGLLSIGVVSSRSGVDELEGADVIADDMAGIVDALLQAQRLARGA